MTPFQRARDSALALRRKVFGSTAESGISSEAVISAITAEQAEDLDVALADPSDNALGGADAVLVRSVRQIVVRNDTSVTDRAFLIAHELGHWKLHEGHADTCSHVIESTLVPQGGDSFGAQKVEAYGARERSELQANVFARELLLPRLVARELFLAGETAQGLHKTLDLPLELVRQQLLDGLLLPSASTTMAEADEPIVATPEQMEAATSKARVSLLVAGPGTGKTATLMMRIQHLLEAGTTPSEILVLTFSNRAARELVARLEGLGLVSADDLWVGTFHGFGLEFLRKNPRHFGLSPTFGVADKMAQISLIEPHIYGLGLEAFNPLGDPLDWLHETVKTIQRAKDELCSAAAFNDFVEQGADEISSDVRARQRDVGKLYRRYEELKREAGNLADLGDLIMLPACAIKEDAAKFEPTIGRFKHILVDEYQDVNRASAELVKALAKNAKTLWVVGDARQAIYRFRGASMRSIVRFGDDFPKYKTFHLTQNRRSHEEIIRIVKHTGSDAHPLQGVLPLGEAYPVRGESGVKPVHISCETKAICHGELAQCVGELHAGGVPYRKQVVLAPTHDICGAAADALNRARVPALHLGDIFQRPEIKDILTLLQALVDRSGSGLARISRLPGLEIPGDDVSAIVQSLRLTRPKPMTWLTAPPNGISAQGATALYRWMAAFEGLDSSNSPWDAACALLLDRTDVLRPYLDGGDITDVAKRIAIWQLIYFLRAPQGGSQYQTIGSFLANLRRRLRIHDDRELRVPPPEAEGLEAVSILTIHQSKGLEFEAVHLVDIDAYHFRTEMDSPLVPSSLLEPMTQRPGFEGETEASNKLYVALSRARSHLYLYEVRDRKTPECVPAIKTSGVLVKRVTGTATLRDNAPRTVYRAAPPKVVELAAFLTYRVCPRRYFYDFVKELSPSAGLHPSAIIEAAVMRDLFIPYGEAPDEGNHLNTAIELLGRDYESSTPYLRAYGDQLLQHGRRWLGQDRVVMAKPFMVECAGVPIRVCAHRIAKEGQAVTLHFARAKPLGRLRRQEDVLRWMLSHLSAAYPDRTFTASIFVLSTGSPCSVSPMKSGYFNNPAAEQIMESRVDPRNSPYECPKCRHFMHCPD